MIANGFGLSAVALGLAVFAAPAQAETIEENATELVDLLNWTGERVSDFALISKFDIEIDPDCNVAFEMVVAEPAADPAFAFTAQGSLAEIDPATIAIRNVGAVPRLEFNVATPGWIFATNVASPHPLYTNLKTMVDSGDLTGACDATECKVEDAQSDIQIPVLNEGGTDSEARIIELVQNLTALCVGK